MSLDWNQKAQRIYGPNGIPGKIQNEMHLYHVTQYPRDEPSGRNNMILSTTFAGTDMSTLIAAHGTTQLSGIIIGHKNPFQFWAGVTGSPDNVEVPGIDEISTLWPNHAVNCMKVDFSLNLGKMQTAVIGRICFFFRWLRADDIPTATMTQEQIRHDQSWTRVPFSRIDAATELSARPADKGTSLYVTTKQTWKGTYEFDEDDQFFESRVEGTGIPLKPLILQFQCFNMDQTEDWAQFLALDVRAKVTLYYEHDRINGTEVFIEA